MSIPDYISPIIGYRVWKWEKTGLKSLCGERWKPSQLLAARCRASVIVGPIAGRAEAVHDAHEPPQTNCTCGVYASKSLEQLLTTGYAKCGIHGEVYLWGTVVEHELGWRAQFAYPKTLFLPSDLIPSDTKEMECRLGALSAYGTDIFIVGHGQSILLYWKGSGFDAAGLDYLIGKRTQYYARRQRDRTLMRGDRVAVLGRGIAVVEHVDETEVEALLGNKTKLRMRRNDIAWNRQNMRWEAKDLAP
jgi:preprotein translocase subunit YajC